MMAGGRCLPELSYHVQIQRDMKQLEVPFLKISVEGRSQDLLERFSVEAAVQDPCVRLSRNDLRARPLLSSPSLCTRSPPEVSWQDLCLRSL